MYNFMKSLHVFVVLFDIVPQWAVSAIHQSFLSHKQQPAVVGSEVNKPIPVNL